MAETNYHDEVGLGQVPTEENVANQDKILPTDKSLVTMLAALAGGLALLGAILSLSFDQEMLGLIVCILAVLVAFFAAWDAYGDARARMTLPVLTTIIGVIMTAIVAFDMADAPDRVRTIGDDLTPARVDNTTDSR